MRKLIHPRRCTTFTIVLIFKSQHYLKMFTCLIIKICLCLFCLNLNLPKNQNFSLTLNSLNFYRLPMRKKYTTIWRLTSFRDIQKSWEWFFPNRKGNSSCLKEPRSYTNCDFLHSLKPVGAPPPQKKNFTIIATW